MLSPKLEIIYLNIESSRCLYS